MQLEFVVMVVLVDRNVVVVEEEVMVDERDRDDIEHQALDVVVDEVEQILVHLDFRLHVDDVSFHHSHLVVVDRYQVHHNVKLEEVQVIMVQVVTK
jgi:hypothetical protein